MSVGTQFLLKRSCIEPERRRIFDEMAIAEGLLVLEQYVVHLPKSSLYRGALRSFRRMLCMRMRLAQRKIPKDEPELRSEPTLHVFDNRIGASAVRAFVVAVLDQRHSRAARTLRMVARPNGQGQARALFVSHGRSPSSAP